MAVLNLRAPTFIGDSIVHEEIQYISFDGESWEEIVTDRHGTGAFPDPMAGRGPQGASEINWWATPTGFLPIPSGYTPNRPINPDGEGINLNSVPTADPTPRTILGGVGDGFAIAWSTDRPNIPAGYSDNDQWFVTVLFDPSVPEFRQLSTPRRINTSGSQGPAGPRGESPNMVTVNDDNPEAVTLTFGYPTLESVTTNTFNPRGIPGRAAGIVVERDDANNRVGVTPVNGGEEGTTVYVNDGVNPTPFTAEDARDAIAFSAALADNRVTISGTGDDDMVDSITFNVGGGSVVNPDHPSYNARIVLQPNEIITPITSNVTVGYRIRVDGTDGGVVSNVSYSNVSVSSGLTFTDPNGFGQGTLTVPSGRTADVTVRADVSFTLTDTNVTPNTTQHIGPITLHASISLDRGWAYGFHDGIPTALSDLTVQPQLFPTDTYSKRLTGLNGDAGDFYFALPSQVGDRFPSASTVSVTDGNFFLTTNVVAAGITGYTVFNVPEVATDSIITIAISGE